MDRRLPDLVEVLRRQQVAGIAWGVCLRDDFDPDVQHEFRARIDFAMFDSDEVVTYFRRAAVRRFQAVFNMHGHTWGASNGEEIEIQRRIHTMLLGECWIVNNLFAEWYTDTTKLSEEVLQSIRERGARHNELLRRAADEVGEPEQAPFLFAVRGTAEIEQKLTKVRKLARSLIQGGETPNEGKPGA